MVRESLEKSISLNKLEAGREALASQEILKELVEGWKEELRNHYPDLILHLILSTLSIINLNILLFICRH